VPPVPPVPPVPTSTTPARDDWPAKAADEIVKRVDQVKGHTTDHAIKAAKFLAYGMFAGIVGTVVLVVLLILTIRLMDTWIDGDVWIPYAILGSIFLGAGLFCWRKRGTITT
jgi:hypothetical protein